MVRLKNCPGLKVEVDIDKKALEEFTDPVDSKGATRYIKTESGKHFAIRVTFSDPFPRDKGVLIYIFIDGTEAMSRHVPAKWLENLARHGSIAHFDHGPESQLDGRTFRQKYIFKDVQTSK